MKVTGWWYLSLVLLTRYAIGRFSPFFFSLTHSGPPLSPWKRALCHKYIWMEKSFTLHVSLRPIMNFSPGTVCKKGYSSLFALSHKSFFFLDALASLRSVLSLSDSFLLVKYQYWKCQVSTMLKYQSVIYVTYIVRRSAQICWDLRRSVEISPDLSRSVQICQESRSVNINLMRSVW